MQLIEVTARFDHKGKAIPLSFIWEGKSYKVDAVGRRWTAEDGEHILIMIQPGDIVYELLYKAKEGLWMMVRGHHHSHRRMI